MENYKKQILSSFDVYLMRSGQLADLSRKAYISDVTLFFTFLIQRRILLENLKLGAISEFHKFMANKGLVARTRARKLNALRSFFLFLHKEHNFPNWTSYLRTPPFEKPLPNILTKSEIIVFLKEASKGYDYTYKYRNQLILFLLYGCGLRVSELVNIRVCDLSLNDSMIRVFGKGSRERLLPIPSICIELIEKHLKTMNTEDNQAYLFAVSYAKKIQPMSRQNVCLIIQSIWKRTGIKKRMYPHLLRHSFASHMMNNGANVREIQSLLGHERLSSTQVYTHLTLAKIKKSYEQLHIRA